jgi:hypothetical protein
MEKIGGQAAFQYYNSREKIDVGESVQMEANAKTLTDQPV